MREPRHHVASNTGENPMRIRGTVLLILSFTVGIVTSGLADVRLERIAYHGWRGAWRMTNGTVELILVPQIGRIMRYGFVGGPNVLWENPAMHGKVVPPKAGDKEWANYGGDKLWPAPQDRWGWPPDPYLDRGG